MNLRALTLPKTKCTDVPPGGDLIYEILTSAPNLTSIQDPHLSYVPQIVAAEKLSLIKTLKWDFRYNEELALNFHRFVAAGPQLKSMNLNSVYSLKDPVTFSAIGALLESSRNTLENVTDIQCLTDLYFSERQVLVSPFPRLPKVTHLEELVINGSVLDLPGRGQSVSEVFPNLKSLHLDMLGTKRPWEEQPSPLRTHSLLEKLKISNMCKDLNYGWVQPICNVYPNIRQLHIVVDRDLQNLPEGLRKIPQFFQQLEQFFIEIQTYGSLPDNFQIQMDQALTGLPLDVFGRLWNSREPDEELQKPDVLDVVRHAPSIWDLRKLTNLTFEVTFKQRAKPLWSHVSQLYAFQPMAKRQGLEVKGRGFLSFVSQMRSDLGPL